MKKITRYKRVVVAILLIVCCGTFLTQCINRQNDAALEKKQSFQQFAGSASCAGCHKNIYDTHIHTAHYNSSQPASATSVKGSFEPGKNRFAYVAGTMVMMEKGDSGFYQVAYTDSIEKEAHRFDIVIGSGTKGQTYTYWKNKQLYQLPVSFFTAANQWSNSPGFPLRATFNRSINSRCMECHSTFVNTLQANNTEPESFNAGTIIYGIDCEKCHGPATQHVAWQTENPTATTAKYITNPATLSRQL